MLIFGNEVDSNLFTARLPFEKMQKAIAATAHALGQSLFWLRQAQELIGFLTFCAKVVCLA